MEFTDFAGGGRVRSGLQRGEASDAGVDVGDPLDDGDGRESGTDSPDVLGGPAWEAVRAADSTSARWRQVFRPVRSRPACRARWRDRRRRDGRNQHEIGLAGSLAGSAAFAGSGVHEGQRGTCGTGGLENTDELLGAGAGDERGFVTAQFRPGAGAALRIEVDHDGNAARLLVGDREGNSQRGFATAALPRDQGHRLHPGNVKYSAVERHLASALAR